MMEDVWLSNLNWTVQ